MAGPNGFLGVIYQAGLANELFPLIIFMGVGAMTDFGPLLSNPKTALLGGAAQFGIFGTLIGAVALSQYTDIFDFTLKQASAISIIGGADGPTSIFIATHLAPELLGAIAVASYSYMALVPIIQPPIMRALTTDKERRIKMTTLRHVSRIEKLIFPLMVLTLSILVLPESTPLIGAFMFGNFLKESGVVDRLSDTMQNALINIVTIFLGLGVGSKLAADQFLVPDTLAILALGSVAFGVGTAAGVIMAKIMNMFPGHKINPLIGSAGVSAVPMAARVSNKVGMEYDRTNMLLMHAMGPNVAGVIGSAVAAGVLLSIFK
jgi:oxaloacetate decarboxylase beta subunit